MNPFNKSQFSLRHLSGSKLEANTHYPQKAIIKGKNLTFFHNYGVEGISYNLDNSNRS